MEETGKSSSSSTPVIFQVDDIKTEIEDDDEENSDDDLPVVQWLKPACNNMKTPKQEPVEDFPVSIKTELRNDDDDDDDDRKLVLQGDHNYSLQQYDESNVPSTSSQQSGRRSLSLKYARQPLAHVSDLEEGGESDDFEPTKPVSKTHKLKNAGDKPTETVTSGAWLNGLDKEGLDFYGINKLWNVPLQYRKESCTQPLTNSSSKVIEPVTTYQDQCKTYSRKPTTNHRQQAFFDSRTLNCEKNPSASLAVSEVPLSSNSAVLQKLQELKKLLQQVENTSEIDLKPPCVSRHTDLLLPIETELKTASRSLLKNKPNLELDLKDSEIIPESSNPLPVAPMTKPMPEASSRSLLKNNAVSKKKTPVTTPQLNTRSSLLPTISNPLATRSESANKCFPQNTPQLIHKIGNASSSRIQNALTVVKVVPKTVTNSILKPAPRLDLNLKTSNLLDSEKNVYSNLPTLRPNANKSLLRSESLSELNSAIVAGRKPQDASLSVLRSKQVVLEKSQTASKSLLNNTPWLEAANTNLLQNVPGNPKSDIVNKNVPQTMLEQGSKQKTTQDSRRSNTTTQVIARPSMDNSQDNPLLTEAILIHKLFPSQDIQPTDILSFLVKEANNPKSMEHFKHTRKSLGLLTNKKTKKTANSFKQLENPKQAQQCDVGKTLETSTEQNLSGSTTSAPVGNKDVSSNKQDENVEDGRRRDNGKLKQDGREVQCDRVLLAKSSSTPVANENGDVGSNRNKEAPCNNRVIKCSGAKNISSLQADELSLIRELCPGCSESEIILFLNCYAEEPNRVEIVVNHLLTLHDDSSYVTNRSLSAENSENHQNTSAQLVEHFNNQAGDGEMNHSINNDFQQPSTSTAGLNFEVTNEQYPDRSVATQSVRVADVKHLDATQISTVPAILQPSTVISKENAISCDIQPSISEDGQSSTSQTTITVDARNQSLQDMVNVAHSTHEERLEKLDCAPVPFSTIEATNVSTRAAQITNASFSAVETVYPESEDLALLHELCPTRSDEEICSVFNIYADEPNRLERIANHLLSVDDENVFPSNLILSPRNLNTQVSTRRNNAHQEKNMPSSSAGHNAHPLPLKTRTTPASTSSNNAPQQANMFSSFIGCSNQPLPLYTTETYQHLNSGDGCNLPAKFKNANLVPELDANTNLNRPTGIVPKTCPSTPSSEAIHTDNNSKNGEISGKEAARKVSKDAMPIVLDATETNTDLIPLDSIATSAVSVRPCPTNVLLNKNNRDDKEPKVKLDQATAKDVQRDKLTVTLVSPPLLDVEETDSAREKKEIGCLQISNATSSTNGNLTRVAVGSVIAAQGPRKVGNSPRSLPSPWPKEVLAVLEICPDYTPREVFNAVEVYAGQEDCVALAVNHLLDGVSSREAPKTVSNHEQHKNSTRLTVSESTPSFSLNHDCRTAHHDISIQIPKQKSSHVNNGSHSIAPAHMNVEQKIKLVVAEDANDLFLKLKDMTCVTTTEQHNEKLTFNSSPAKVMQHCKSSLQLKPEPNQSPYRPSQSQNLQSPTGSSGMTSASVCETLISRPSETVFTRSQGSLDVGRDLCRPPISVKDDKKKDKRILPCKQTISSRKRHHSSPDDFKNSTAKLSSSAFEEKHKVPNSSGKESLDLLKMKFVPVLENGYIVLRSERPISPVPADCRSALGAHFQHIDDYSTVALSDGQDICHANRSVSPASMVTSRLNVSYNCKAPCCNCSTSQRFASKSSHRYHPYTTSSCCLNGLQSSHAQTDNCNCSIHVMPSRHSFAAGDHCSNICHHRGSVCHESGYRPQTFHRSSSVHHNSSLQHHRCTPETVLIQETSRSCPPVHLANSSLNHQHQVNESQLSSHQVSSQNLTGPSERLYEFPLFRPIRQSNDLRVPSPVTQVPTRHNYQQLGQSVSGDPEIDHLRHTRHSR